MAKEAEKTTEYLVYKPEDMSETAWAAIIDSWRNGLSDREAAFRASKDGSVLISEKTVKELYQSSKEIADLRDFLRTALVSQAKLNIAESLNGGSVTTAKWYLERKSPEEFSSKAAVAFEGAVVGLTMEEKQAEIDKLLENFGKADADGENTDDRTG